MYAPLVVTPYGRMMGNFQAGGSDVTIPSLDTPSGVISPIPGLSYSDLANPPSTKTATIGQTVRVASKLGRNDPCW